jgi:hypothetical protein
MGEQFRAGFESGLRNLPLETPLGRVLAQRVAINMGYPGGSHEEVAARHYVSSDKRLAMLFGFYSNFTPHDLICKVVPAGTYPEIGDGASVQFNSDRCVREVNGAWTLVHHGDVTVGTRIARATLVDHMLRRAGHVMAMLGVPNEEAIVWPLTLGSLADLSSLIDRVFCYAYCVEQAKRELRSEVPLPELTLH